MSASQNIEAIIQVLEDKKKPQEDRVAAAKTLGHTGDVKAIEPLIKALGDKDEDIVREVKVALRKMKPLVLKPLSTALDSGNWRIRKEAAELLSEKGFGIPGKLALIANDLTSKNIMKEMAARDALRGLDASAVEPLVNTWEEMAKSQNPDSRIRSECIIDALSAIGSPAIDALAKIMQIGDWPVRSRAVQALGKIKDNRVIELLLIALKDKNGYVRREAVTALGALGNPQLVDSLIGALTQDKPTEFSKEPEEWISREVIGALGKIKGPKAVSFIITQLGNVDPYTRDAAAMALKNLGSEALAQLILALGNLDKDIRDSAGDILASNPELGLEPLLQALESDNLRIRIEAAWLLGKMANIRAKEPLLKASNDPDRELQITANKALEKINKLRAESN